VTRALRGALLAAAVLAPLALFADDRKVQGGANRTEFLAVLNGPDSTKGAAAIRNLDPDNKNDQELLKGVLDKGTWYYRAAAIDVLSKTKDSALLKSMSEHLFEDKSLLIREGMASALAHSQDRSWIPVIGKALGDKDWRVRREVAFSLRDSTEKASVDALIARWKEEQNPLVRNYIRQSLEDVTKYYLGHDPAKWAEWWSKNRDTIDLAAPDEKAIKREAEEARKSEALGLRALEKTTSTTDVKDVAQDEIGAGAPILILPEVGYSKEMMIPFFLEIEKLGARLKYVDFTDMRKFTSLEARGGKTYYPIDKMADAFEQDRQFELKRNNKNANKIAIIACGRSSWVAMRFATRYPAPGRPRPHRALVVGPEVARVGGANGEKGQARERRGARPACAEPS